MDRNDSLAPFSSRGPRPGDEAVNPDVTAPGVGIVAARAAGTAMGSPVDEHYVAASGTSMATPHVARAAALLARRHPEWTAARLKDALISSAVTVDGQKVTEQGGGRIDARAAVLGAVSATGTLALGPFTSEATEPEVSRVLCTNSSDKDISLSLDAGLATEGCRKPAQGSVRLGADSLKVPALVRRGSSDGRSGPRGAGQVLRVRHRRRLRRYGARADYRERPHPGADPSDRPAEHRQGRQAGR
ncbi:S8 family serine peptidase [Streptomyces globisporus]